MFAQPGFQFVGYLGQNPVGSPAYPTAAAQVKIGERVMQVHQGRTAGPGAGQSEISTHLHTFGKLEDLVLGRTLVPVAGDEFITLPCHLFIDETLAVHGIGNEPFVVPGDDQIAKTHFAGRDDMVVATSRQPGKVVLAPDDQSVQPLPLQKSADPLFPDPG